MCKADRSGLALHAFPLVFSFVLAFALALSFRLAFTFALATFACKRASAGYLRAFGNLLNAGMVPVMCCSTQEAGMPDRNKRHVTAKLMNLQNAKNSWVAAE